MQLNYVLYRLILLVPSVFLISCGCDLGLGLLGVDVITIDFKAATSVSKASILKTTIYFKRLPDICWPFQLKDGGLFL